MSIDRRIIIALSLLLIIGFLTFTFLFGRYVRNKEIEIFENNQELQQQVELLTKENEMLKNKMD